VALPFRLPGEMLQYRDQQAGQLQKAEQGLRILMAEDDRITQYTVQKMLEKMGHALTIAEDGQQALDLLRENDFDCILMDIQMPVMDGVEATRTIRSSVELGKDSSIPIIAITAYAMEGDREKFLEAGMDDYLAKPVRLEDLEKALAKYAE